MTVEQLNKVSGDIVDSAYHIHVKHGPGLLESVYELLLARALEARGYSVERQKPISAELDGVRFEEAFRPDLIVNNAVVVEVKAQDKLHPVHERQVLTYMRLLDYKLGLLINFGDVTIKAGIRRLVNKL
ncbi:MAG TPA: GxxExxY protein [Longimicrobiales bacterium]|nr:GxxExxY protein [Longimicrobiales bacterium]